MTPPKGSNLLCVEGTDDRHVILQLAIRHQLPDWSFEVRVHEGIESIFADLPEILDDSRFRRIGVVMDADENLLARWASVRAIALRAGYADVPESPDPRGTVLLATDEFQPRVGFWLMPDNRLPGMLEHFVQFLVPEGDGLREYANQVIDAMPAEERRFREVHRAKAEIHTWLAWQEQPGLPLGLAIKTRYLDAGCAEAIRFVDWLRRLYELPDAPAA